MRLKLLRIAGVVTLFVNICTVVTPVHAQTFSGKNGAIAFTAQNDIWVMGQDGRHKQKIARNAQNPMWSPDGGTLAFIKDGHVNILKSGSITRLTYGNFRETTPVWAVDGSRLAFVRTMTKNSQQYSAIFVIKLVDRKPVNVSGWGQGYRAPSWAPDGRLVYEQYNTASARLVIQNLVSGKRSVLSTLSDVTKSSEVSWSPNGKKILYRDSDNEIYTIWPDGTHRSVISDGESYQASWSPDGKNVIFLEDFSGEAISLSEEDGTVMWLPVGLSGYSAIASPTSSPDKTKVLFTLSGQSGADIFVLDRSKGNAVFKLASAEATEFSWQSRH